MKNWGKGHMYFKIVQKDGPAWPNLHARRVVERCWLVEPAALCSIHSRHPYSHSQSQEHYQLMALVSVPVVHMQFIWHTQSYHDHNSTPEHPFHLHSFYWFESPDECKTSFGSQIFWEIPCLESISAAAWIVFTIPISSVRISPLVIDSSSFKVQASHSFWYLSIKILCKLYFLIQKKFFVL